MSQRLLEKTQAVILSDDYDLTRCGYRYYRSALLHRVEEIAAKRKPPERMELVPVAVFA